MRKAVSRLVKDSNEVSKAPPKIEPRVAAIPVNKK